MIFSIILLIILITINGIFSASELSFLSLDKIQIKKEVQKGNKKAIAITKILNDPSSFLSTIQIGITLAGFLASAFAADYFADYFLKIITIDLISPTVFRSILVVIITIVLSYFTLVFGELVPKKLAINNPYKIASTYVGLINFVRIIFYPLIKILTLSTEFICKILHIEDKGNALTEEDIKKMILLGKDEGIIEEKEKEYILNVFDFNDRKVGNVMTPQKDVIMLDIDLDDKELLAQIKKAKFTRFPVYKNDKDNVVGILNIKDFIMKRSDDKKVEIKDLIRPIKKFDYNEKIDDVFRIMQENNESLCAIYKNEKFVGIVTVEDAIEEIVGNIYDEFDSNK